MTDKSSRLELALIGSTFFALIATMLAVSFYNFYQTEKDINETLKESYERRIEHMEKLHKQEIEAREYFHESLIRSYEDVLSNEKEETKKWIIKAYSD